MLADGNYKAHSLAIKTVGYQSRTPSSKDQEEVQYYATKEDVLDTIRDIEKLRSAKRKDSHRIMEKLSPLIKFLDKYGQAFDVLVQVSGTGFVNPAALIWGLLRVVLEVSSATKRCLAVLCDIVEDVGLIVSLYSEYEVMLHGSKRFDEALTAVYADIAAILSKVRGAFQKSRFKLTATCARGHLDQECRSDMMLLKRHASILEAEVTLAYRQQLQSFIQEKTREPDATMGNGLDFNLVNLRSVWLNVSNVEKRSRVMQWLNAPDSASRLAEIDYARHESTCEWLFGNPTYISWLSEDCARSLWIYGPPGIGKTVLSSAMIAEMKATESMSKTKVAFYHCDTGNRSSMKFMAILSSLVAQLAGQSEVTLPPPLLQTFETAIKFGRFSASRADSLEKLLELLIDSGPTTFVLDGLDEMDEPQTVLAMFLGLVSRAPKMRLALLTRDTPTLRMRLKNIPRIEMTAATVQSDIEAYVQHKVNRMLSIDKESMRAISQRIIHRADGMFLWARMVMQNLSAAISLSEMSKVVDECPPGLQAMYDHFIENLQKQTPQKRQLAGKILTWCCFAKRPLSIGELQEALMASEPEDPASEETRPLEAAIMDICRPFICRTADHVRLLHHSAREYLRSIGQSEAEAPHFPLHSEQQAHTQLAIVCVKIIRYKLRSLGDKASIEERNGFNKYAMLHWTYHTIRASHDAGLRDEIYDMLSNSAGRQTWLYWQLFKSGRLFPFQETFRLQTDLSLWWSEFPHSESIDQSSMSTDWSLDVLEMLMTLNWAKETDAACQTTLPFTISYFDQMMVVRDLARRLTHTGQLSPAVQMLEQLRDSPVNTNPSLKTPLLLSSLGVFYDQQGRAELSLHTHRKAGEIQTRQFGQEHLSSLWSVNEIGRIYRHMGMLEESERMHRRALESLQALLTGDHPEVIWTINTLATTIRQQGRPDEARKLHETAYDARLQSLGEEHPHTLWSCGDVAKCYHASGLLYDALYWYQKAYEGRLRALGPDKADTMWSLNHLGVIWVDLDRFDKALECQMQAFKIQEEIFGMEHPHTLWTKARIQELKESQTKAS